MDCLLLDCCPKFIIVCFLSLVILIPIILCPFPLKPFSDVVRISPSTSNLYWGVLVFIPTLPELLYTSDPDVVQVLEPVPLTVDQDIAPPPLDVSTCPLPRGTICT